MPQRYFYFKAVQIIILFFGLREEWHTLHPGISLSDEQHCWWDYSPNKSVEVNYYLHDERVHELVISAACQYFPKNTGHMIITAIAHLFCSPLPPNQAYTTAITALHTSLIDK